MKRICFFFLPLFMLCFFLIRAQSTAGTEFWVTFGENNLHSNNYPDDDYLDSLNLQLRFVSGENATPVTIYFTNLNTSVTLSVPPLSVVTYTLPDFDKKQAVYNKTSGISNYSIRINSDYPITAYALNQSPKSTDATNLLPTPALGTEYHQISYIPRNATNAQDAYAVIATEDHTMLYHNNETTPIANLSRGQVYYLTSDFDMTGIYVATTKPVAFFSLTQGVLIPADAVSGDCFMQQLAPVNTWGYSFFVPVSDLTSPWSTDTKDRVRIVASQNNTTITKTGGVLITDSGGQTGYTINKGEFIELEIYLSDNGCYITADKPIGVCTYLTTGQYNNDPPDKEDQFSDPSIAWLPSMEQTVTEAIVAPFVPPPGSSELNAHFAIIVTSKNTKDNTTVSIGGAEPENLSGGIWRDHDEAGISFYNMPLNIDGASYLFENQNGLVILGYGTGYAESYYYLAYSAMRNLQASFYANNIHYQDLPKHFFCENDVVFQATINVYGMEVDSFKWYIDGLEKISVQNKLIWDTTFSAGTYEIELLIYFNDDDTLSLRSILNIGAVISTSVSPPGSGSVEGGDCYKVGTRVNLVAIPNPKFRFVGWLENGAQVSSSNPYTFTAEKDRTLVALFEKIVYNVNVTVNDSHFGNATGAGPYDANSYVRVEAFANKCYRFINWTIDDVETSTNNPYLFTITKDIYFVAHFDIFEFEVYAAIICDRVILLDLKQLEEDGYDVMGCKWFKNGIEVETHTNNEFSYSEDSNKLLEPEPTYYMFQLTTKKHGELCRSKKITINRGDKASHCPETTTQDNLRAYPNPVLSGKWLTLEGNIKDRPIYVLNHLGACVHNFIATDNIITFPFDFPQGIYLIRAEEKIVKVVTVKE